ncbi:MAG: protein kinase [Dehalococcoidales bacterium]|nr:protein kinase [Dehalococcoidales bacterium]
MKCLHCQADNPENSEFCRKCGKPLKVESTCPQCGHTNLPDSVFCNKCGYSLTEPTPMTQKELSPSEPVRTTIEEPISFVDGRYQVKKKLGEGGKKKVYLVHDKKLDRDVAFALIKTENLDEDGRKRVTREAQAMGKLGDNPHIVSIYDMGEINGQPYIVIPLMSGGDVEGLIEKATDHKLPLDQVIGIAKAVCNGLDFAHSKGVIHRDIKPGNVWLTEDGTAKIGDFGLAVMTDVSRLTMEGMMVGTYSYMSPEQAMGGEVTEKADLYSLGAMLYEMVTGRPPFVGDDYVAVVTQHINNQPILPTWHRADLSPGLESLIMLLLEKDPGKRPASANDVLKALESIEKGDLKEPTVETQVPTENPLYRRIFVGREQELKQLKTAFDGAMSGQGSLVMVVGEPGIGKTSVCEQLKTYVTLKGGKTLIGYCYEEGSLSLPYLAFVEAMHSYILDREVEDLKKELGSGATDVAKIVSEVREKLHVKPRESQNPEEDRYRLMQAVSSFLANAAAVKPMLVILEDLHDADKGTLEMLSYVSRNLVNTRLLIVGTYRDVEVDRTHPLSAALAELRRVSTFGRVLLRGLSAEEVGRMLTGITGEEIPFGLAQAVHNQTEGNPLFVQEVVRYLTEEKLLVRAGGKLVTSDATTIQMSIPEGLRDVIGKRLSNLSEECNKLLSIAAVIGREFRLDVLQKVADIPEDDLLTAIEEAKNVAIIEERSTVGAAVTYRFAHAFFQTILYEENIAPRRIRLHQQVAKALEEVYANRLQEHASELAEHFSYSTEPADLTKAVSYGEMAAQRATDVYEFGEAVRLLQQAIKVQEVLDPDDKGKRCDLLLVLAEALRRAGEPQHALEVECAESYSIAKRLNDADRIARSCIASLWAIFTSGSAAALASREGLRWAEEADQYARDETKERSWVDFFMGTIKGLRGSDVEGHSILMRAREQAIKNSDQDLLNNINFILLNVYVMPWSADEILPIAEEVAAISTGYSEMTRYTSSVFWAFGKRRKAEALEQSFKEMTLRSGQVNQVLISMGIDQRAAHFDGRLEEAIEIMYRIIDYGNEINLPDIASHTIVFNGLRTLLYIDRAKYDSDNTLMSIITSEMNKAIHRRIPLLQAHLGEVHKVNDTLEWMLNRRPNITSTDDMGPAYLDLIYLESAVLAKHEKATRLLLDRFSHNTLHIASMFITSAHLQLGAAAAMLERFNEARAHYNDAIENCSELRFRPDLALSHLHLAELLLDQYPEEKAEAIEHLDFAIKEFREMKMQPSLERALRRKDILKA